MAETRKLAAILAADVVGYSRLAGSDEERFAFPALSGPPTITLNWREVNTRRLWHTQSWAGRRPSCRNPRVAPALHRRMGMADFMANRVVVVTGGASGIGRATAAAFAREGARVVIGDVDVVGAEETVASIRNKGGEASCVRVDVTKQADVEQMINSAVTQYGGLDYAFNNAGLVGSNAGVVETTEEDWHRVMAINLTGVWLCTKYEIPPDVEARQRRDRE